MLATCAMPNIVKAFERFETKNHVYLIMELIEGGSLSQYISSRANSFSEAEAKSIMRTLLQTVSSFHQLGIIHRDIKLENILMKEEGGKFIPKMIDFGLSIHKADLPHIEEGKKYAGTPNFVPPEIFCHQQYDETIDVFSLGVILHFMLTRTLPFHGVNFAEIK
jgi:serine/threonine protein kinase